MDKPILENVHSFLRGMNRFYANFDRKKAANQIIWQEGSTHVIDYSQIAQNNLPILFFIPSLINKSYILNLTQETSLVQYFAKLGYRVYLVDFNEPLDNELNMGFIDYQLRIERAINAICKNHPIITIGYCLGAIFSCALHSQAKSNLVGQILIAVPWDFSHFKKILGLENPLIIQNFILIVSSLDKVSPALVQWFFSAIDPHKIWNKFSDFADMQDPKEVEKFLIIEQWVNDGISLSKKFALEMLSILHKNNLKQDHLFKLDCSTPSLIIGGLEDKIAPPSAYVDLCQKLSNKQIIQKNTGHIGLIVSKLAREEIWIEMRDWLDKTRTSLLNKQSKF